VAPRTFRLVAFDTFRQFTRFGNHRLHLFQWQNTHFTAQRTRKAGSSDSAFCFGRHFEANQPHQPISFPQTQITLAESERAEQLLAEFALALTREPVSRPSAP